MIKRNRKKKRLVGRQHEVEPTPQIVVSALFNSIFNADSHDAMGGTIEVFINSLNGLCEYDEKACDVFLEKLYTEMMKHDYTRFGIGLTGEKFVEMGITIPKE